MFVLVGCISRSASPFVPRSTYRASFGRCQNSKSLDSHSHLAHTRHTCTQLSLSSLHSNVRSTTAHRIRLPRAIERVRIVRASHGRVGDERRRERINHRRRTNPRCRQRRRIVARRRQIRHPLRLRAVEVDHPAPVERLLGPLLVPKPAQHANRGQGDEDEKERDGGRHFAGRRRQGRRWREEWRRRRWRRRRFGRGRRRQWRRRRPWRRIRYAACQSEGKRGHVGGRQAAVVIVVEVLQ